MTALASSVTDDEEFAALLAHLNDDEPKPGAVPDTLYCSGTFATFYTNRRRELDICTTCPRFEDCANKHANNMDRVECYHSDCFSNHPEETNGTPEPVQCRNCFVVVNCVYATRIMKAASKHEAVSIPAAVEAAIIVFPASKAAVAVSAPVAVAAPVTFSHDCLNLALAEMQSKTAADVTAVLRATSQMIREGTKTNYTHELRLAFLAASIDLNTKGIMPAFRPACRGLFDNGKPISENDTTLANDLRVIDLDYIIKHHPHGHGEIFKDLLNDDETLNLEKAMKFATHKGSGAKKAELLQITPAQQAELFIIRDEKTRKRWDRIRKSKHRDLTTINAAINAGRKGGDPEQHWQLYALCVVHSWSVKAVLDSARRLPNMTMSASTMRRTIRWLTETAKLPSAVDL